MKKLICLLLIIGFISCEDKIVQTPIVNTILINQDKFEVIKVKCVNNQYETLTVYIIDSCEYLGSLKGLNANYLTHKGNCKHCIR